jgi:uncharacterized protein (TIGR03437 family)
MNLQVLRLVSASLLSLAALTAQQDRIARRIDGLRTVKLPGSVHPKAQPRYDRGPVDPSTRLGRITMLAKLSPRQQADLDELLRRQQIRSSPNYHRWLTPEQFGDRFGLSTADLGKIVSWLESEGFQVEERARARNWVAFSGTARQVARAFGTEIHRYEVDGETHLANATEVSIPVALEGVVNAVSGLHDFQPKPAGDFYQRALSSSTASSAAWLPLTPDDFATIYNLKPLYASGIDGTGVNLAVIGFSPTYLSDVRSFRALFHLPAGDPQVVLVGPAAPYRASSAAEAVLDLEWAGAVAPNASLIFVYSGNLSDGLLAAIDRDLAKIISMSGAVCETDNPFPAIRRSVAQQAVAQGITWMASSGDAGAAGCDPFNNSSHPTALLGLAVELPACFPEVTAVGGTQLNGDRSAYWTASDSVTGYSALSYIPETSWNETATYPLLATGGGASVLFSKPDWQTGPGVPDDSARDVPDVSLVGAANSYVTFLNGQVNFTGGGTSASAPAFAGVVALLNQYLVRSGVQEQPGLGNINPTLYSLAQLAPHAFHDIATGSNIVPCAPGSPDCATGFLGYSAGPGYDPVTGLGSIDAYELVTHWNNPGQRPILVLSSPSGTVERNPAAAPSCQWSQRLLLQEQNGVPLQLTGFKMGAVDLSSQIVPLFGSSHLAAFGSLRATICESGITPPQTLDYEIEGTDPSGATIMATLRVSLTGPASAPSTLSASPPAVTISVSDSGGSATGSIAVSAGDGGAWTASVFPENATTNWLTVSPLSGTTPAQLSLAANASGFANGVYRATLILRGTNTVPQFLEVPVTLVIGASPAIRIDGVTNAASFQLAAAPGMMAAVFGSGLAPSERWPSGIPLPLQMNGVSATINGVAAPLLYVSPGQLNIQVPYEAGAGPAIVGVDVNGQVAFLEFAIAPSAPGIFAWEGTLVPTARGRLGDTLPLFMTGEGDVSPFFGTNRTAPSTTPLDQLPKPVLPVTVTVGGLQAAIQFIGIPSGLLGTQINFTIPPGLTAGVQPLVVTVNGVSSPPVNLTVAP